MEKQNLVKLKKKTIVLEIIGVTIFLYSLVSAKINGNNNIKAGDFLWLDIMIFGTMSLGIFLMSFVATVIFKRYEMWVKIPIK